MRRLVAVAILSATVLGWAGGAQDGYREADLETVRAILDAVGWMDVEVASVVGTSADPNERVSRLDLSWRQGLPKIQQLPAQITKLPELQTLSLADNALNELSAAIGDLRRLLALDLDGNQFTSLPLEVTYLSQLRTFSANNNALTQLPSEIKDLQLLRTLRLDYNLLASLPESIRSIRYVKVSLLGNRLCDVSDKMAAWLNAHFAPGWRDVQFCDGSGTASETVHYGVFRPGKEPGGPYSSVIVDETNGVTVRLWTSSYVLGSISVQDVTDEVGEVADKEKLRALTITPSPALASVMEGATVTMSYAGLTGEISAASGIAIYHTSQETWVPLKGEINPLAREISVEVDSLGTFGLFRGEGPGTSTARYAEAATTVSPVQVERTGAGLALILELSSVQPVRAAIYRPGGELIQTVGGRLYDSGTHRFTLAPAGTVAQGMYLIRTTVGTRQFTHRVVLGDR